MPRPKIINIPFYYLSITQKYFKQNICLLVKGLYFLEYFLVHDTIYVKLCQECRVGKASVPNCDNLLNISLCLGSNDNTAIKHSPNT